MRIMFVLLSILTFLASHSQDTLYVSYDDDFKVVSDSLATHQGILVKEDNIWQTSVYNLQSKKLALVCYLSDKEFKLNGLYRLFSPNGKVAEKGYYNENLKEGTWKRWDDEGNLTDSIIYEHGEPIVTASYQYANRIMREYHLNDQSSNHVVSREWNEKAVLQMEADFQNKRGFLKNYHSNGNLASITEFDEKGKPVATHYFNSDGAELDKKQFDNLLAMQKAEAEINNPQFPSGPEGLKSFIKNNFIKTVQAGSKGYSGEIKVEFYLDEKGRVVNFRTTEFSDPLIDNSLKMLFNKMPSWNMKGHKTWGPVYYTIIAR